MRSPRRTRRTRGLRSPLPGWVLWLWLALGPGLEASAQEQKIAVLPFRVHSAQPVGYLGESVANLMRSRLEATGRIGLIDGGAAAQSSTVPVGQEARTTALRKIAAELGADYVVSGSITELAGHFSLDVRVTAVSPLQPGRTLVLTAADEDELLERVNELADSVLAHVVEVTPVLVVRVELLGAGPLEPELRGLLRTREGGSYNREQVRADAAALRADPLVARAEVDAERGPGGVAVIFRVVPTERLLGERPGAQSGVTVAAVQIRGNRRIEADAIRARIGTEPGQPYDQDQIASDLRDIHSLGFFRDVRVFSEDTVSGLVVIFDVEENPVVRQISISGNDSLDGEKIRDILTLTLGSALDYPLLFENRARVEGLYRAQGYYLTEVSYEIETLSEAAVGIHFIVDENEKLKLKVIEFAGNEQFTDKELRRGFKTKTWRFYSFATSWFDRSGTYSEPLFLQDLREVEKRYTDAGYLQVQVGEPNVIPDPEGMKVTVPIEEGNRFTVGSIDMAGDDTVDKEVLRGLLQLGEGDWFNRSALTDDVTTLTEHYTDRGFYFASVQPLSNLSEQDKRVDVVFELRKGPLYFIRNVEISGNTTTIDPVVRREVPIVEGQLYSQRAINIARARIRNLGFFEEVDFQVEPTDQENQIDLELSLVEKPTGSLSFGAGFSSQDSLVAQGSLAQTNLFGRGYSASLSLDIGGRTQRFFLSLQDPYFLGSNFSLGATLFRTSLNFEDFKQDQIGADFVLGHALSEDNRARGFARYSFASRTIKEDRNSVAGSVIQRSLFQDDVTTSAVGLSFISDQRDDRAAPRAGYQVSGGLDFAGLGGFSRFVRGELRGTYFLGAPDWMADKSTFVVGARMGWAVPFNSIGDFDFPGVSDAFQPAADGNYKGLEDIDDDLVLPLSERYFLGGLGSFQLRGFKARSVGPRRTLIYEDDRVIATPFGLSEPTGAFLPVGRRVAYIDKNTGEEMARDDSNPDQIVTTVCDDGSNTGTEGNNNGKCNDLDDKANDDFDDLDDTDVIGGNKFITTSFEYRFPISETLGLQGLVFIDAGNAFAEGDNLFNVSEWRYGTGLGVQWFSPFGPLGAIIGVPLDRLSEVEDFPVFEFSVGGQNF